MEKIVIGFGELLWDMLPAGKQIGGAPGNFAFHAAQCGMNSCLMSAVGADKLGDELLHTADLRGLRYMISKTDKPTGTVDVRLDDNGIPQYEIHENVAWDFIPFTPEEERLVKRAEAFCFGTLAQRNDESRATLLHLLELMKPTALKIFDINLRQHFYDEEIIRESLSRCNVLKLNEDEIKIIGGILGDGETNVQRLCEQLLEDYALRVLILTCGAKGSYVMSDVEKSYLKTPQVNVVDTVGAGDAFTAAFCSAYMFGKSLQEAHRLAVEISAYVCTQHGAMPVLPDELKNSFK